MSSRIGIAILAAGASTRLGRPKQLLVVRGTPLVTRAVASARSSSAAEVAVVLGAAGDATARVLAGWDVDLLDNPVWTEGMGSSIRVAAAWAIARAHDALLLMVCDQPRLDAAHLDALLEAHRAGGGFVASAYGGIRGVPAVFPARAFPALAALRGHGGAASILRGAPDVVDVPWSDGAWDIDTEADHAREDA